MLSGGENVAMHHFFLGHPVGKKGECQSGNVCGIKEPSLPQTLPFKLLCKMFHIQKETNLILKFLINASDLKFLQTKSHFWTKQLFFLNFKCIAGHCNTVALYVTQQCVIFVQRFSENFDLPILFSPGIFVLHGVSLKVITCQSYSGANVCRHSAHSRNPLASFSTAGESP